MVRPPRARATTRILMERWLSENSSFSLIFNDIWEGIIAKRNDSVRFFSTKSSILNFIHFKSYPIINQFDWYENRCFWNKMYCPFLVNIYFKWINDRNCTISFSLSLFNYPSNINLIKVNQSLSLNFRNGAKHFICIHFWIFSLSFQFREYFVLIYLICK